MIQQQAISTTVSACTPEQSVTASVNPFAACSIGADTPIDVCQPRIDVVSRQSPYPKCTHRLLRHSRCWTRALG